MTKTDKEIAMDAAIVTHMVVNTGCTPEQAAYIYNQALDDCLAFFEPLERGPNGGVYWAVRQRLEELKIHLPDTLKNLYLNAWTILWSPEGFFDLFKNLQWIGDPDETNEPVKVIDMTAHEAGYCPVCQQDFPESTEGLCPNCNLNWDQDWGPEFKEQLIKSLWKGKVLEFIEVDD